MSALKDRITEQVKTSMKARELEKVKVLRNVQSVIKQIEIDRKKCPSLIAKIKNKSICLID